MILFNLFDHPHHKLTTTAIFFAADPCSSPSFNDCDDLATCTSSGSDYNCTCPENYDGDGFSCTGEFSTAVV